MLHSKHVMLWFDERAFEDRKFWYIEHRKFWSISSTFIVGVALNNQALDYNVAAFSKLFLVLWWERPTRG